MANEFVELEEDNWFYLFKPTKNHIDENASFDGHMFETYSPEVDYVKEQDVHHIWTYGDGDDGGSYIWNGWHFVNRIGYFISEVPWEDDKDYQIQVSPPWFFCENCNAEIEDPDNLIRDKFDVVDFYSCPQCVTPEQLKEIEEANA